MAKRDLWDESTPPREVLRDSGVMGDIRGKERNPMSLISSEGEAEWKEWMTRQGCKTAAGSQERRTCSGNVGARRN